MKLFPQGRAFWLQETRMKRFEEALAGWHASRLSQSEAALLLGVCERTFRRQIARYEADGLEGLLDKRISQASHRLAPVDEVMDVVVLYRRDNQGWYVKQGLEREALSRLVSARTRWSAQLYVGEAGLAGARCGGAGQGARQAPQAA